MLPSLDGLKCFCEAARLLNFRAASRVVRLTPAALGQRIKQLEEQIGEPLFIRTTRSVVLTEAGLQLLPFAQRALAAAEECLWAGKGLSGAPPMDLVIGSRHELAMSWIVPMLPTLNRSYPHITFHLYVGSGSDLITNVGSLGIDCAITSTRLMDPKFDSVRLHGESYVFVGSGELLSRCPLLKAADASEHVLVDINEALPLFQYWRDAPGGVDSMRFQSILRMGTIALIRELVLRGEGVAVLPEYFVKDDLSSGKLVQIMPKVVAQVDHFRLIFRADDPRRSFFSSMAETMKESPLA